MNIRELKIIGNKKLEENNIEDSVFKAEKLLQYVLNIDKTELLINNEMLVDKESENEYLILIDKLIKGKPLQYITNCQEFMKLNFFVDQNVLIPQPDTEILVEEVLDTINKVKQLRGIEENREQEKILVLDLCTGSGAIGISIKKYITDLEVYASDISKEALKIAELNAKNNDVQIQFINSDMLENIKIKFDIIVSNPPYIETKELEKLPKDVQNEPQLALDGGEDGLKYYKIIRDEGYKFLKDNGAILLEIGYNQNRSVPDLFRNNENYKNIEIYKDLSNIDRVVKIEKS